MTLGRDLILIKNETDDTEEQGCSNTTDAPKAASMKSDTTAIVLQEMSYVGGIEVTEPKASGKGRKLRPPTLLAQTAAARSHGASRSASPSTQATSRRSSAYRAVHEAVVPAKPYYRPQKLEKERTVARLSEDKAERNREYQAIAKEIEPVQNELRLSANRQAQGQDMQAAEMNVIGHRILEMKDRITTARNVFPDSNNGDSIKKYPTPN